MPAFSEEGYLINPEEWTEEIAETMAWRDGIELTADHWELLRFVRAWYTEHGVAPSPRDVGLFLKRQGHSGARLHELFPYGYVGQVCRIAGMKRPRSWSTG